MCAPILLKANKETTLATLTLEEWLEAIPVGVVLIDTKGTIAKSNSLAKEIFRLTSTQNSWHEVLLTNVKGTSDNGHYIYTQAGRYVLLKTQALPDNCGQLILLIDGSELKESNEFTLQFEKIHSIAKLSATLAHQLRTPLATATLYAANLSIETLSKDELKNYQTKINEQLHAIKQQIDNVLLVHKGNEAVCERVAIANEMDSIATDFRALHAQIKLNVKVEVNANTMVIANKTALRGALNNIIENAIQASSRTKVVDITLTKQETNIHIQVIDYGDGIPPENLNQIASGFFTTKKEGNGLGLAISRSIIEAHGGTLSIDSLLGSFTKITIALPYKD